MRQDLIYYRIYITLRPDHEWRLISYLYYAKYTKVSSRTTFKYIDINIPRLLEK